MNKISQYCEYLIIPYCLKDDFGRKYEEIKDFIPKNTLFEMFSYFFVNCMITISAVSFLANTSNKPVSLMINQFEAQMQLESAAVVSLMILVANLMIKGFFYILKMKNKSYSEV